MQRPQSSDKDRPARRQRSLGTPALEIFGAEAGCSAPSAPNAAVLVGRPRKSRPEMSVLSHLTSQKWPKPDRLLSGDWGLVPVTAEGLIGLRRC